MSEIPTYHSTTRKNQRFSVNVESIIFCLLLIHYLGHYLGHSLGHSLGHPRILLALGYGLCLQFVRLSRILKFDTNHQRISCAVLEAQNSVTFSVCLVTFGLCLDTFLFVLGYFLSRSDTFFTMSRSSVGGESVIGRSELFCTTQDTIFFIFVVDSLAGIAALRTEIEVAMEVENEHLAEVAHLRVLCVRSKGRRLLLLRGEWQLCRNTVKCYC